MNDHLPRKASSPAIHLCLQQGLRLQSPCVYQNAQTGHPEICCQQVSPEALSSCLRIKMFISRLKVWLPVTLLSVCFQAQTTYWNVDGLGHQELVRPSQGDLAFRDDSIRPQEEPVICPRSSKFVLPVGIQHSKELNRTCCLNGGTCMLGSFCACPPSFFGWNCEHDVRKKNYGSVPHDTWLPKKCSLCKCWHGQLRCFPQTFLPGCDGLVMDEHLMASGTPELPPSARTPLMLAGICLSIESYY
ncbi:putative protein CRIPTO3 [Saimiri boliviensis]|uniref:putative protein CRIPTO3 n=1 Tax=Saimiri boliviensis TaxID=27679 RepID=UPI000533F5BF|nr:putative teratocarcinoma-derived growth factor 3 [Saimiri boliviensis boliviensis]